MENKSLATDGGYGSRKLWFSLFSIIMVLVASKLCPGAGLGEVVTGIVAICGIYVTGNAAIKWRAGAIEQAQASIPGVMGKAMARAVDIAEEKDAESQPTVEAVDDK